MKHYKLTDNHNKEGNATRFSDIRTPVTLGKPRGFSRCVQSFFFRARVFEKKKKKKKQQHSVLIVVHSRVGSKSVAITHQSFCRYGYHDLKTTG